MNNKKVEKRCECCGKNFISYASNNRKYCCKKCATTKNWEKRDKAKTKTLTCEYCKKSFKVFESDPRFKRTGIKYCSKNCSDKARRTGSFRRCEYCDKEFYSTRNKFCSQKCVYEYRKAHNTHKIYYENGYKVKYINGYNKKGNVKEHRYIMEQYIGRKLKPEEIVHHIDGDKTNNEISNLKIMTRGEHSRLHRLQDINNGKKLFTIKEV